MTIYAKRTPSRIYRKIYEAHHGAIPREENGRSYEIHHIDGDHSNNNIENLVAVTLQEHYDIHYSQEDYRACYLMAAKLGKSVDEMKKLSSLAIQKQIKNGTFNFLKRADGTSIAQEMNRKRLEDKTHIFINPVFIKENTEKVRARVAAGTHNWCSNENHHNYDPEFIKQNTEKMRERVANGTHHLLGANHHSYDHTLYTFEHTITGERVTATQNEFVKRYNLNKGNVHSLVKRRKNYKTVSKWRLVTD